jgi:N-acetylneuraminic acid mutarotase
MKGSQAALALIFALILNLAYGQGTGNWSTATPMKRGWEEMVAGAINGTIYIVSGYVQYPKGITGASSLPEWRPVDIAERYDPVKGSTALKNKLPSPVHHAAAVAFSGKIYLFGGFLHPEMLGGWSSVANAWAFDPQTESWSARAPMPTPRGGAHAAVVGNKIYVIGGYATSAHRGGAIGMDTRANEEYDPATDRWIEKQPMPTPRNHHAVGVIDGKIYVAGGRIGAPFTGSSSHIKVMEVYDPIKDIWARRPPMPTARSGLAYGVIDDKLFVIGGEDEKGTVHKVTEAYDPKTERWIKYPDMPIAKHGPAFVTMGRKIYILSGNIRGGGGSQVPSVEVFEPDPE